MIYDRIKSLREVSGLTQTELAKKLGITRSSVNAWEMGTNVPSTQYIVEMAKIFKVSTDSILDNEPITALNLDSLSIEEKEIIFGLIQYFDRKGKKD